MIQHIRSAFRSIRKHKSYAIINIVGLTLGLAACLVVATVVIDDLSYDKFWKNSSRIYRVISVNKMGDGLSTKFPSSFAGLRHELPKNFAEVDQYAGISRSELRLDPDSSGSEGVMIPVISTDSTVWDLLNFDLVAGRPRVFVAGKKNLVITESLRDRMFGKEDPLGKIIKNVPAYGDKPSEYLVTGVIKDIPQNTHLRAEAIVVTPAHIEELNKKQWGTFMPAFVMLKPGSDVGAFTKKVNAWYAKFVEVPDPYQFEFQPIEDVYLKSDFAQYQQIKGNLSNVYIFSGVAILLLVIACVNFINLSTARSVTRLRETAVMKVLGASKGMVISKFLAEALVIFFMSAVAAIIVYQLSLRFVEMYLGHELSQTFVSRTGMLLIAVAIVALIAVLTGLYPAWLVSGFKTANSLKGSVFVHRVNGQHLLRRALVVLQFAISIVVLVSLIVVYQQMNFMKKKDIGFDKENLMSIDHISWDGKGESIRNEIAALPGVESASITSWVPSSGPGYMSRDIEDPSDSKKKITVWHIAGDIHLAQTIGFRLKSGRLLDPAYRTDLMNADSLMESKNEEDRKLAELRPSMMTESTMKILKVGALNAKVNAVKTVPVGVIQDFHNQSFHEKLGPTIIFAEPNPQYGAMLIRIKPGAEKSVRIAIKKIWPVFFPSKALEIAMVDTMLDKQYEHEARLGQLFSFFSILTMALAALGIFGLVVHAAQQRVKEIGVRKVLGASILSIFNLLSKDFVRLVVIALIVASPIGWYVMNKWLEDFSYRVNIQWWVFGIAGLTAVVTALLTVSFQSIKAAIANPVSSLRDE